MSFLVLGGWIVDVGDRSVPEEKAEHFVPMLILHSEMRLSRLCAYVRCHHDVLHIVECIEWLIIVSKTSKAAPESLPLCRASTTRLLVHHRSSCDVDENSSVTHQLDRLCVDQVLRLRIKRGM